MKIVKFIVSFLFFLGILVLMVWSIIKSKEQTCNQISILINSHKNTELLTESDVLHILQLNKLEWKGKAIKEIDPASIHKILAQENYIKTVEKVHFIGSKLQIEVTLFDILLEVQPKSGEKFLLDVNGTYLPYSPKAENGVIVAQGTILYNFKKKETINQGDHLLSEIFTIATLIREDTFYSALFKRLSVNDKQELILHPTDGNLPVLFGVAKDAPNKLKSLKYMYDEVLPYMDEGKYAQLDVRFKNRIVATKSKT